MRGSHTARLAAGLVWVAAALAQPEHLRIGEIEFYGYSGIDLAKKRAALPVHEGEDVSEDQMEGLIGRIKQATQATAVTAVCCDDKHGLMIYLGLAGRSSRDMPYNPAPKGTGRLAPVAGELERQFSDALTRAMGKGETGEDQSKGYALSENAELRARQMAMRKFALSHGSEIRRVLARSSDTAQRAIAAHLTGYARQSAEQIAALVRASRDPDDEVRNVVTRGLWVLAASSPKTAARIPAAGFIEMLSSRQWTDRNKSSLLLEVLTRSRDAKLLGELRERALDPLIEIARWRSKGHALAGRMMLGRCAGIEEGRLAQLVEAGDIEPILEALRHAAIPGERPL